MIPNRYLIKLAEIWKDKTFPLLLVIELNIISAIELSDPHTVSLTLFDRF